MAWYSWSRTSSANATADASINFAEGQAPSSLNDSCRAVMSASAMYRDDISGAIVTGGTSTAYTVTSYSVFDTLAHMNGQMIAFSPHATNGATVTLNVDGLGAKPLRSSPSVELLAGMLIQGTPYVATYNNSDAVWYLQSFYGNPYNMPLAGGMDFWGTTVPNSSFAFPIGQAISRATYSALFAIMSTTYGAGDGSTTFNLPDKTGRVSAMKEAVATRLTSAGSGVDGATMGAAAGAQNEVILQANLPNVNFAVTASGTNFVTDSTSAAFQAVTTGTGTGTVGLPAANASTAASALAASGGSGTALKTVQPTIVCNYIIRII